jgi:hypothetical protein
MKSSTRIPALVSVSLVLAACGGGGGGSAPADTTPRAVTAQGPITGFGSVIVGGVHYETSGASFSVDDQGGFTQDDLAVGQIVTVRGRRDAQGRHFADDIRYEAELKGPIESIDLAAQTFVALGQTVQVNGETVFRRVTGLDALTVGSTVEVSGMRNEAGALVAAFIEREDGAGDLEVHGRIANLDTGARRFTIGTLTVDYAGASLRPTSLVLSDGLFVEVEGLRSGGMLVASKVEREDDFDDDDRGHEAEIEGYVLSVDDAGFEVGTTRVLLSASTRYEGGTRADIQPGVKVEAEGSIDAQGPLVARKVQIKRAGPEGKLEGVVESVDAASGRIGVLGVEVQVVAGTRLRDDRDDDRLFAVSELAPGDYIEASFVERGSALELQRLEREDEVESRSLIEGRLDTVDAAANRLVIAGVEVDTSAARFQADDDRSLTREAFFAAVAAGDAVKAKGRYMGGVLSASEVELEGEDD